MSDLTHSNGYHGPWRTTAQRKRAMLAAYPHYGTVMHAAEAVGIGRRTHTNWLKEDPEYAAAFEAAKEELLEVYEREIQRRGVEGWEEPVYQGGQQVGSVRKYSDVLLIFRTKALAPERYRDRSTVTVITPDSVEAEIAKLEAEMAAKANTPDVVQP